MIKNFVNYSDVPYDSPVQQSPLGGFINYDLLYENRADINLASGLFELGIFSRFGVGTTTYLAQGLDTEDRAIRLSTTFTHDQPEHLRTIRLGDSINRPGAWGRSVRFGGLQWSTNFGTKPQFIPFPLPTVRGEATLPSTVDLYTDSALRLRDDVPAGPFEISNAPVINGAGELRVVVRDLLGREQIVTQPYYVSQQLLRSGLNDDSLELGFIRRDFGFESNEYGRAFVTATRRSGLTEIFTGEVHGEFLQRQQTLGFSATSLWLPLGTLSATLAGSRTGSDQGGLLSLGIDHQSRRFNAGVQTEFTTSSFTQLGLRQNQQAPRNTTLARLGFALFGSDFLSLSVIDQDNRGQSDIRLASAGYGFNLWSGSYLSLFAFKDLNSSSNDSIGITFSMPLGSSTSVSSGYTARKGYNEASTQIQRNLPEGSGFGYRLQTVNNENDFYQGAVLAQSSKGTYTAEAAQFEGDNAYRLNTSGAVAMLGNHAYFSRRIDDSFGVVRIGDYENVQVYADNQPVAKTNHAGYAFIPRLRPYENNSLSFNAADLPLEAQVQSLELDVTPAFRSGVNVDFPVSNSRVALFTLLSPDGEIMPPGSVVSLRGSAEIFPVALEGKVYVTGLKDRNHLQSSWLGQPCTFVLDAPKSNDPLPDLGTIKCEGVAL